MSLTKNQIRQAPSSSNFTKEPTFEERENGISISIDEAIALFGSLDPTETISNKPGHDGVTHTRMWLLGDLQIWTSCESEKSMIKGLKEGCRLLLKEVPNQADQYYAVRFFKKNPGKGQKPIVKKAGFAWI